MTRAEEILKDKIDREKGYGMSVYDVSDFDVTNTVLEAINQFAKEQSIAFESWCLNNNVEKCLGFIVSNFGTHDSLEEVFQLFIEHQNKDK